MVTVITLIFFTFWLGSYNLKDQRLEIANVEFKEFIQQRLSAKLLEELSDSINNRSSAAGLNASSQSAGMGFDSGGVGSGSNDGTAGTDNANKANRAGFDGFAPDSWLDFLKEIQGYVQDNPGGLFTLTNPTVFFNDDGTSKIKATNDCRQDGPRPLDTYMYTPNGLRKLQYLDESGINVCVALPGSVCVDSCTGEIKVHRKCTDTSRLNFEQDPSSYEEGDDVRSRYEVENHCPAEDETDFTQTTTDPIDPTREIVMDPFFYVQKLFEPVRVCVSTGGDEMICEYVEVNLTIPAPPVEPRAPLKCNILGRDVESGVGTVIYRKRGPAGACVPCSSRERLTVMCIDGILHVGSKDGSFDAEADLSNLNARYDLSCQACDCRLPSGRTVAHDATWRFFASAQEFACNRDSCNNASTRRCQDGTFDGRTNFHNESCTINRDRCFDVLRNKLLNTTNPTTCASLFQTPVVDRGDQDFCTSLAKAVHGSSALARTVNNGTRCEIRDKVVSEQGRDGKRLSVKRRNDGSEFGTLVHFSNFVAAGQTKSQSEYCEALGSKIGMAGFGVADKSGGDASVGGQDNGVAADLNWVRDNFALFGINADAEAKLRGNNYSLHVNSRDDTVDYAFDFFACSKGCVDLNFISYNSPIIISLDGLMPNGAIDARFSYDGKTVVDTKWPIFDAAERIGFLAYDFNGNGIIDDGTELFGEYTGGERFQHGYDALSYFFDGNGDGVVTGAELEGLMMWKDLNGDGVVTGAELEGLMMWKDLNGDGKGSAEELTSILSYGVTELDSGKNTDAARIEMEGGVASPVSLERGVVWRDENNQEQFGASFDVWYTKKEE